MKSKSRFLLRVGSLVALGCLAFPGVGKSEEPKVSTYAPAKDLESQVDRYIKDLTKSLANEADYQDEQAKIAQDANTLVIVALALGLHDEPSKYRGNAGLLMKAAQQLAATTDYAAAKSAAAALESAAKSAAGEEASLKWEKAASLPELMKAVPRINTKLKMNLKGKKFQSKAKDTAGYTAVLAAIAQGSIADTSPAKDAAQVKQWQDFCRVMRDHAGALNAAICKGDEPTATAEMKKLTQSCDDCHAVFHPGTTIE